MNDSSPPPALASVLYLRLADFSRQPVAEQARRRAQLEAALAVGLDALSAADRLVLDTADGLVVVVLANVAGALAAAERCLKAAEGLGVCAGANHGPVVPAQSEDSGPTLVGDGIRAAQVAAGFAPAGQLLVTRAFREAVAEHAPTRGAELREAGVYSDASVRTHELFRIDPDARLRRRRRLLAAGMAGVVLLAGAGAGLRGTLSEPAAQSVLVLEIEPGGELLVDGELQGTVPPLTRLPLPAGRHTVEVRREHAEPLVREIELVADQPFVLRHRFAPPARLAFDVSPDGEVLLDGRSLGAASALGTLQLKPGPHRVELRHADQAPVTLDLNLVSDREEVVRHRFAVPAVLVFDVSPGGAQLFVDGKPQGALPADGRVSLPPGRHLLELHQGQFSPLKLDVTLKPGEEAVIRHRFTESKPRELFGKIKKALGFDR